MLSFIFSSSTVFFCFCSCCSLIPFLTSLKTSSLGISFSIDLSVFSFSSLLSTKSQSTILSEVLRYLKFFLLSLISTSNVKRESFKYSSEISNEFKTSLRSWTFTVITIFLDIVQIYFYCYFLHKLFHFHLLGLN